MTSPKHIIKTFIITEIIKTNKQNPRRTDKMISRNNAEHYIWGNNCDGWRLINEEDRSIIHERMPTGTSEIRHLHKKSKQFFFILSGTMTIEADGIEYNLKEHEGIEVLPTVPHQVFNRTDRDIEFLVISQPNTRMTGLM